MGLSDGHGDRPYCKCFRSGLICCREKFSDRGVGFRGVLNFSAMSSAFRQQAKHIAAELNVTCLSIHSTAVQKASH